MEHQQDSFDRKWGSLGAVEYCLEFHGHFNWIKPKTFSTEQYHRRKIRKLLEIKKKKKNEQKKKRFEF